MSAGGGLPQPLPLVNDGHISQSWPTSGRPWRVGHRLPEALDIFNGVRFIEYPALDQQLDGVDAEYACGGHKQLWVPHAVERALGLCLPAVPCAACDAHCRVDPGEAHSLAVVDKARERLAHDRYVWVLSLRPHATHRNSISRFWESFPRFDQGRRQR